MKIKNLLYKNDTEEITLCWTSFCVASVPLITPLPLILYHSKLHQSYSGIWLLVHQEDYYTNCLLGVFFIKLCKHCVYEVLKDSLVFNVLYLLCSRLWKMFDLRGVKKSSILKAVSIFVSFLLWFPWNSTQ